MRGCSFIGYLVQKRHEKSALKKGELIRCNHCGNIIDKEVKYCQYCGKSMERESS